MGHGIITRRGIDTSSATATSGKIVAPYTAFVNGEKVTGGVIDYSGSAVAGTPYNVDGSGNFGVRIQNSGVYSKNEIIYASAASVGIDATKIIENNSILGVAGKQSLYEEDDIEVIDLSGYTFKGQASQDGSISLNTSGTSTLIMLNSTTSSAVINFNNTSGNYTCSVSVGVSDSKVFKFVPNTNMAVAQVSSSASCSMSIWQK